VCVPVKEGSTPRLRETETLSKIASRGNHKNVQCSSPGLHPSHLGAGA
jgi:hypothetical protein